MVSKVFILKYLTQITNSNHRLKNGKGRGQAIRLLFHLARVEFQDIRISHETWETIKQTMPQRRLPVLEVEGMIIPQSGAILRYLGREYGLYGKTNKESTRIDVISGAVEDMVYILERLFYVERVEEARIILRQEILSWRLPEFLDIMESALKENKAGDSFFVGDQVSIADVHLFSIIDWMQDLFPEHPFTLPSKINAFMERFRAIPNIENFLTKP